MTVCALIRTLHQEFGFEFIPFLFACRLAFVFLFRLDGFFHFSRRIFIRGHRRLHFGFHSVIDTTLQLGMLPSKKCVQCGRIGFIGFHQQGRG